MAPDDEALFANCSDFCDGENAMTYCEKCKELEKFEFIEVSMIDAELLETGLKAKI